MIEVPLTNDPAQKFSIVINDIRYDCFLSYNKRYGAWSMNVSSNGSELINGLPLVSGINIIDQFTFFDQNVFILDINNPSQDPTFNNLGSESKMLILEDSELNG